VSVMHWLKAVVIAFSSYSQIPMPQLKWDDEAMKVAIAFLPLVGLVMGGIVWAWLWLCSLLELNAVLFAAVTCVLVVLITGGIHMDGFADTADALAAHQDQKRSLEIMKDPHLGAFAMIRFFVYLLLYFALLNQLYELGWASSIVFIFLAARCFGAWSTITMANARKEGFLVAFTQTASKSAVGIVLVVFNLVALVGMVWMSWPGALAALVLSLGVTLWYRRLARRRFGGATGDTTGFYIQMIELALLAGVLLGQQVWLLLSIG